MIVKSKQMKMLVWILVENLFNEWTISKHHGPADEGGSQHQALAPASHSSSWTSEGFGLLPFQEFLYCASKAGMFALVIC